MSRCLVLSGPPCAGKSTLAALLAARFGWPLLSKDVYKEQIFRRLGASDRDWSRRVSLLAWDLLLSQAEAMLACGLDCVLEGNFRVTQAEVLARLAAVPGTHFFEVECRAAKHVLLARYRQRAVDATRHPGHVDLEALPEIEREFDAAPGPVLAAHATVLVWDTTRDFDSAPLVQALETLLAPGATR